MKSMQWLPIPNRHDGDGYTTLVDRKNGAALFGAWVAILQVASRCEPRGTLLREGQKPHDEASLARMTRLPKEIIAEALRVCLEECKWLEISGCDEPAVAPQETAGNPQATDEEGKGREGKEENGKEDSAAGAWDGLPEALNLADFKTSWLCYVAYRKERHLRPLGPRSVHEQWQEMVKWGRPAAISSIRETIRQGWQGLFPPKVNGKAPPGIKENIKANIIKDDE